jgi:hypothetical protein
MSAPFDRLERDLVAAAGRLALERAPVARPRRALSLALAGALALLLAAAAGGATYYVLSASSIAPFKDEDLPPEQRVAPGTSAVLELRARDPDGAAPPWALRLAHSRTGLLCGTVGQVEGGLFGIVGLDGRFRTLPEANADACGQEQRGGVSLLGTRVFDADRTDAVRTVLYGVASERLEAVTVATRGGRPRPLRHSSEGAFVLAFSGYPEDVQPVVRLRWSGERTRRIALASSPSVVPDPLGGQAWKLESFSTGRPSRTIRLRNGRRARVSEYTCMNFHTSRGGPGAASSPMVCGRSRMGPSPRRDPTLYFDTRRLSGRTYPGRFSDGNWNGHPPRTAVWGNAGIGVVRELVITAPGVRRTVRPEINGAFLVVLDPDIEPGSVRVAVHGRDGSVRRFGSSHGVTGAEVMG